MHTGRSVSGSRRGLYARENAGMSSESEVRNFTVEYPRFPGEGSSTQGKSGPKPRPKGVGDGQQVDIPVLDHTIKTSAVTQEDNRTREWKCGAKHKGWRAVKYTRH